MFEINYTLDERLLSRLVLTKLVSVQYLIDQIKRIAKKPVWFRQIPIE